jgi:hypothetical protein
VSNAAAPLCLLGELARGGWQRDPASPHDEPVHTRELLLEDPLMSVLDLQEVSPDAKRIVTVNRAMQLICDRDWR